MSITPQFNRPNRLPVFEAEDKGIEQALNILARSIESVVVPDIRLPQDAGTMEWNKSEVLLRPKDQIDVGVLRPWAAKFESDGSGNRTVQFCPGTVNGVLPSNWNEKFSIPTLTGTNYRFCNLEVTSASGSITGATLSLDSTPIAQDSIAKSVPPTSFGLTLGVFYAGGYKMIVTHNLQATPVVVYYEQKASVAIGQSPTDSWYRWNFNQIEDSIY